MTDSQKQKFAEDNFPLILGFLSRRLSYLESVDKMEDWYGIVSIAYLEAVHSYKEERGAFSTHAFNCMNRAVIDALRKIDRRPKTVPLEEKELEEKRHYPYSIEHAVILNDELYQLFGQMQPIEREVCILLLYGERMVDIERKLKLSHGKLFRIRDKIKSILQRENYEREDL